MDSKNWFEIDISRGPITGAQRNTIGLTVHVRADSAVEEFFRQQSGDRKAGLDYFGRGWVPLTKGDVIEAYICERLPTNQFSLGRYTVDAVSMPLLTNSRAVRGDDGGAQLNTVNLSFLKLAGISSPEGVKFGITGAYSLEYIGNLNRQLVAEAKQFLMDYITPVNVKLKLISKE